MNDRGKSIILLLNRLALHCPVRDLPEAQAVLRMEDTIRDLMEYHPEQIAEACAAWRRGNNPFFPTSGQLITLIKNISETRIQHPGGHARVLYREPKALEGPRPVLKPWRQILAEKGKAIPQPEAEQPPKPAAQETLDEQGELTPERRAELRALRDRINPRLAAE